jgi:hypothetical protein
MRKIVGVGIPNFLALFMFFDSYLFDKQAYLLEESFTLITSHPIP